MSLLPHSHHAHQTHSVVLELVSLARLILMIPHHQAQVIVVLQIQTKENEGAVNSHSKITET